ncbi:unnamed protein product [Ambrosiozyma monospora]|uniref:Phospholipid-transporting ATPase n=1 Tax=Ambrosiozyma monospora TaxID=43982 RepID=A0A9W7DIQ5_AMBMO|nr:unnamed protein product [Ambrosiozyma monospora]
MSRNNRFPYQEHHEPINLLDMDELAPPSQQHQQQNRNQNQNQNQNRNQNQRFQSQTSLNDSALFDPFSEDAHPTNANSVYHPYLNQQATQSTQSTDLHNTVSRADPFEVGNPSDDDDEIFSDHGLSEIDSTNQTYLDEQRRRRKQQSSKGIRGVYNQIRDTFGIKSYDDVGPSSHHNSNAPNGPSDPYDDIIHDHRPPPDRDIGDKMRNLFDVRRLFNKNKNEDDGSPRVININDNTSNQLLGYMDNHISTTKYNAFTFVPKFLFQQFSKYANLFFLFTSAIQQVPGVTPTNRFTTILTLGVVLMVSAIKEISEDLKRGASDTELNKSKVEVLDPVSGQYTVKKWINVKVGDILKINNGEPLPADLILLSSSEPEGLCYIETANLDGETNLKIKQAREETSILMSPQELIRCQGKILSEKPNSSLYTYEGTLFLNGHEMPLNPDQMLLRGANLRNTNWIQGIVIFTGHETKLMRNATATPIKTTDVERIINLQIIALFGILISLAIVSALGDVLNLKISGDSLGYLHLDGTNKVKLFFSDILTYWILFSNLVPISLFVTVEIVKYYQAYLIGSDLDMYYETTDTPTVVRTSSLVEELGQIQYIFSDKTGTLTCNIMEFKTCSIGGRCYIDEIPEDKQATMVDGIEMGYYKFEQLQQDLAESRNKNVIDEFLTLLAACHTVIPEIKEDGSIKYQAASPDEGALVDGAASLGYKFHTRKPSSITISVKGQDLTYELLNICEFNSTRKRMSALFRCPDGSIRLYVKGADTVILSRLSENNEFVDATTKHLEDFAVEV